MSIRQVYDTTALLSMSLKKLDLLRKLDIDVFVPVSVMEELSDIGKYRDELGDAAKEVIRSGTIERVELENEYKILAERIARFPRVDRGEAEEGVIHGFAVVREGSRCDNERNACVDVIRAGGQTKGDIGCASI